MEACDDLLAEVAALGEGDAPVEQFAGFVGDGLGAKVEVVERGARFDAGDVEGVPAGGAEANALGVGCCAVVVLPGVLDQRVVHALDCLDRHVQEVAGLGGEVVALDDDVVTGDAEARGLMLAQVGDGWGVEGLGGDGEQACGGGAVEGEGVELVGDVCDVDILGEDEFVEGFVGSAGGEDVEVDEHVVGELDESEVGVDTALAVAPEGGAGVVVGEIPELGGDHAVEEFDAVFAGDAEGGAEGEVEEDAALADGGVLGFEFAVGLDDFGAVACRAVDEE